MICQSNAADLSWQVAGCDNRIAAVAADRDKYKADLDAAVDKLANCTSKPGKGGGAAMGSGACTRSPVHRLLYDSQPFKSPAWVQAQPSLLCRSLQSLPSLHNTLSWAPPHSAASTVGTDNDVITLRAQNQALTYELNDCQDELSQREQDYEHLLLICAAG